jgi:hypothetical protein
MLADQKLKAFIPTVMPGKAKRFYKDVLGLTFLSEDEFGLDFDSNGILLRVTIVPAFTPHPFTVLGWHVADIKVTIELLIRNGLVFEKYPFFEQDEQAIWTAPGGTKVAWFKDPDANLLSLDE